MIAKILERKKQLRLKRKLRGRAKCVGCETKPRVSVFRSNKHFYAQAINDALGTTIASIDGCKLRVGNNKEDVAKLATEFANVLKEKGIAEVVFDRNGYLYHGVVATFAQTLRDNGIVL
ncbi:50S ribosomal protein L18 [Helicobacter sp. 13S00401-1]|uniref:50S ribosomal protein L18 n=1 Tax=Helicobacter sp. 13S00401-1 TaxID=1905758 RepID=UPI000BA60A97|nr:50S ribosomal protein L18 [Helicobacter sp. 13S00401-1]PAF51153.1 50S ribosomal protein L18 [Helicobacter sp. 13S00401-1]